MSEFIQVFLGQKSQVIRSQIFIHSMLSQEAQEGRSPQQWQPRTTTVADDCQRPKLQHDAPSTKPSFVWQHVFAHWGSQEWKKDPNKKYKPGNSLDINAKLARPLWKKHNSTPDLSLKVGVDTHIYMQIVVVACKIAGAVWKERSKQSWD